MPQIVSKASKVSSSIEWFHERALHRRDSYYNYSTVAGLRCMPQVILMLPLTQSGIIRNYPKYTNIAYNPVCSSALWKAPGTTRDACLPRVADLPSPSIPEIRLRGRRSSQSPDCFSQQFSVLLVLWLSNLDLWLLRLRIWFVSLTSKHSCFSFWCFLRQLISCVHQVPWLKTTELHLDQVSYMLQTLSHLQYHISVAIHCVIWASS